MNYPEKVSQGNLNFIITTFEDYIKAEELSLITTGKPRGVYFYLEDLNYLGEKTPIIEELRKRYIETIWGEEDDGLIFRTVFFHFDLNDKFRLAIYLASKNNDDSP